ncbi:MAG: zinc-ribbon domain containing protein [Acidobacteria bacterium]|nr:zinc-ribbon domain containing protein [Acidobacteriota bacterium]MBI3658383.1 zinc-ribbon domain containing protein [Acidobacteriota bacterium]
MLQNKDLTCADCGSTFAFTVEDQQFYQDKGFTNEPKRCKDCRAKRRRGGGGGSRSGRPKRMFPATCAVCGQPTEVPFKPTAGRPIKCRPCMNSSSSADQVSPSSEV